MSRINSDDTSSICYICTGLMDKIDVMALEIHSTLDGEYEFNTFLIGTSLAAQFIEREDEIRAILKIRGMASIKHHITSAVRKKFRMLTRASEKFDKPDVLITVNIFSDNSYNVTTRSRSIIAAGRYTKNQRGIYQKTPKSKELTESNANRPFRKSIEEIITYKVLAATMGSNVRFNWIGSEDKNSLVLGAGRPFFVEILNPKKRSFSNNSLIIEECQINARLAILDTDHPRSAPRSRTVTKIMIHCSESLSTKDLRELTSLTGTIVKLKSKFSLIEKKIYSVSVDRIDKSLFYLTIDADSGLPIKQFVGGKEYANPNISMLLGSQCDCLSFDILDVSVQ
ncbi:MAG TPA: hypothetical protein VH500_17830 [Nitrososphaeraceae archaeon]